METYIRLAYPLDSFYLYKISLCEPTYTNLQWTPTLHAPAMKTLTPLVGLGWSVKG